jgi:dienelactone hydrolase
MKQLSIAIVMAIATLTFAGASAAQPAGITRDVIARELPREGAPLAVPGPYEVVKEAAFGSPGHAVFRPAALDALPAQNALPIVVWGNGGCARDSGSFGGYLRTLASHGFLVVTTAAAEGAQGQASAADLVAALDWAFAEAARAGSPLRGRIDTSQVAVMGVSCGGFLAVSVAADPRVDTVGVFNSGVQPPGGRGGRGGRGSAPFPTTDALAAIHGPALYLNGAEPDFMMAASAANFEAINHVPAFYGARDDAGHSATYFHPGGGEFANVASDWLKWRLKGDAAAGATFVGENCRLCTNPNWETKSKGLK